MREISGPCRPFAKKIHPVCRNLSYTYPGCTEPALRDVSFTLEAGETLAVVGYNGSGKLPPSPSSHFSHASNTLTELTSRQVNAGKGAFPHSGLPRRRAAHQWR